VLKDAIIHASIAWIAVAPFGILILYRILKPVFERAAMALPGAKASAASPS